MRSDVSNGSALAKIAAVVLTVAGPLPATVMAEERSVSINSEPTGAQVYQLKGFRRELLGETPMLHQFQVPSSESILRVAVERSGFERKTLELTGKDTDVDVRLVEIPLIVNPAEYGDSVYSEIARDSTIALRDRRAEFLEALEPWRPLGPAVPEVRSGQRVLRFDLENSLRSNRLSDTANIASNVVQEVNLAGLVNSVDAIVLNFGRRSSGGIATSVGTRFETEMVCEGAMVPTQVWDSCATRSATTSTTSYGTSTQYKCVGGTVTRQVYNRCARRVPKQKAVVDIRTNVDTAERRDALLQVIELSSAGPQRAGGCEFRDGRHVASEPVNRSPAYLAVCEGSD